MLTCVILQYKNINYIMTEILYYSKDLLAFTYYIL